MRLESAALGLRFAPPFAPAVGAVVRESLPRVRLRATAVLRLRVAIPRALAAAGRERNALRIAETGARDSGETCGARGDGCSDARGACAVGARASFGAEALTARRAAHVGLAGARRQCSGKCLCPLGMVRFTARHACVFGRRSGAREVGAASVDPVAANARFEHRAPLGRRNGGFARCRRRRRFGRYGRCGRRGRRGRRTA